MMKFRKKPVVIEARQYFPGDTLDGLCAGACGGWNCSRKTPGIHTLEGTLRVTSGDWIITGVKGEKYPCKPDIFELMYEEVK